MSYGFNIEDLKNSISKVGLINKPCIIKSDNETFEIVTGFRRILSLKELNINEIECFDLTDLNMSDLDSLEFALHDNLFTREFNLVEKSLILNRLTELVKDNNLIGKFIYSLNINRNDYELVLKITKLDDSIKKSIVSGTINIKALKQLVEFKKDDILLINKWINSLKLSYNHQIQFIEYINDISRIEKISICRLLNEEYFANILNNDKKNIPQKAKILIDDLRKRRNPDYSKYKNMFDKKIKNLKLPPNIKIKHSKFFESEGYQTEIDFKNGKDLKKSLETLISRDGLEDIGDPRENE